LRSPNGSQFLWNWSLESHNLLGLYFYQLFGEVILVNTNPFIQLGTLVDLKLNATRAAHAFTLPALEDLLLVRAPHLPVVHMRFES